jgi:hypothetical protein
VSLYLNLTTKRFARFLFRLSRGNTFTSFTEIEEEMVDPRTHKPAKKSVFVVYFQDLKGSRESAMANKVLKACGQFGANIYDWPCIYKHLRPRSMTRAAKYIILIDRVHVLYMLC